MGDPVSLGNKTWYVINSHEFEMITKRPISILYPWEILFRSSGPCFFQCSGSFTNKLCFVWLIPCRTLCFVTYCRVWVQTRFYHHVSMGSHRHASDGFSCWNQLTYRRFPQWNYMAPYYLQHKITELPLFNLGMKVWLQKPTKFSACYYNNMAQS